MVVHWTQTGSLSTHPAPPAPAAACGSACPGRCSCVKEIMALVKDGLKQLPTSGRTLAAPPIAGCCNLHFSCSAVGGPGSSGLCTDFCCHCCPRFLKGTDEVQSVRPGEVLNGSSFVLIISGMQRPQLSPWTGQCGPTPSAKGLQHNGLNF